MAKGKSIRVNLEDAEDLLREAYDNSYRLLMGEISFRGLERECRERDTDLYLVYYRDVGPTYEEVRDMLEWYEDYEWYERCGAIKRYMDKKFKKGK